MTEALVARVRKHARRLTPAVLLLLVDAAAAGYFIGSFAEPWQNWSALAGAICLAIIGGALPVLHWLAQHTIITTRRIVTHHGVLIRKRSEISLARVSGVETRQTVLQRMWGSGDLHLQLAGETTVLHDVAGVKHLQSALSELAEINYADRLRQLSNY